VDQPRRLGQYQADLAWLEDSSHLDRLDLIKSPCLAMAFEHDCWFPPRAVRAAAERIPGCQYTELAGLGHGAPLLAAGQVNSILAAFTRSCPAAGVRRPEGVYGRLEDTGIDRDPDGGWPGNGDHSRWCQP